MSSNPAVARIGYADPPYPGLAHLYRDHPDYAGEVDHAALIARLESEFDGWILHTHAPGIAVVSPLLPEGARWGAWVKTFAAFKKGVRPAYAWEPVIFKPCRRMDEDYSGRVVQRDWIACPMTMRRGFTGAKPEAVCHWAFEIVGARKGDLLNDLFPGSGAVSRAWESWRPQIELLLPQPGCVDLSERSNTDTSPKYSEATDAALSYESAIKFIGEQVKSGIPLPTDGYFGGKHD